ncbi:MAG: DUF4177 domain-containing protein [Dermatophilaceae bacterium]
MVARSARTAAIECVSSRALENCVLFSNSIKGRPDMAARYEYRVVQLREGLIGGKMSSDKLEKVLNDNANDGWQLKAITAVEVKGRMGPGGVEGVLVTFERPLQ